MDECTFNNRDNSGASTATAVFYVDDGLTVADTEESLTVLAGELLKAFSCGVRTHRGAVHEFLSMKTDFSAAKQVKATMVKYTSGMMLSFEVSKARGVPTRADLHRKVC